MAEHNRRPPTAGRMSPQEFARQVNAGMIVALDRLGQPIGKSALVLFKPSVDTIFEVIGITPSLDPRQPQGMARLTLHAQFDVPIALGVPLAPLVVVGYSNVAAGADAGFAGATPSPPTPEEGNGGRGDLKVVTMPEREPAQADTPVEPIVSDVVAADPDRDPDGD